MTTILDVEDLHGYYGKSHVLQGVALTVGEGELVTLLGRNGAGKSTTLKAIAGVVAPRGHVRFRGKDIAGQPAHRIAAQGLCLVPEHRGIFKLLTVEENLKLGARRDSPWQLADIYRILGVHHADASLGRHRPDRSRTPSAIWHCRLAAMGAGRCHCGADLGVLARLVY